jgi:hypothetical protein
VGAKISTNLQAILKVLPVGHDRAVIAGSLGTAGTIERIDEPLEASYSSADLGNLTDPLDETIFILDHGGAETMRGEGDLLFEHGGRSERLQELLVRPADVEAAVSRWQAD